MSKSTRLERRWKEFAPSGWLARLGRESGFIKRNRKLTATRFFWALVLGLVAEGARTFRGLARFFTATTGVDLTDSAVQEHINPAAVEFMRRAYKDVIGRGMCRVGAELKGVLARFRDVSAFDSTVLRLRKFLAKKFPASRTNHTKAAAKLHVVMSLKKAQIEQALLTAERVSDHKGVEVGPWAKAQLLLFDLGYFSWALFGKIRHEGGYFISRMKSNCNGVVKKVRKGMRGPVGSIGRKFSDCIPQGLASDFDAEYGQGRKRITLRTVCVYNPRTEKEHWYLTNLPPSMFSPEEIAECYRLRWQVERLFLEMKSELALDDLRSKREEVVRCFIYATLITLVLSRFLCTEAARFGRGHLQALVPHIATKILGVMAVKLTEAILGRDLAYLSETLRRILETIAVHAVEPNPGRPGALRKRLRPPR